MSVHEIKICPHCGKRGFIGPFYQHDSTDCLLCCACGWRGNHETVEVYKYEREKTVHFRISYNVVDDIVRKHYGDGNSSYAFAVVEECRNDTIHEFVVDGILDDYAEEHAARFREIGDPGYLMNGDILNILCQDGWLEPGTYLVEVCW